ncbi:hypothetical protein BC828DRAFT_388427 [Blastocladiella britannica]|nr:hypothetical protein BC828DRAFT_388427 [Blastocladiella britannica]
MISSTAAPAAASTARRRPDSSSNLRGVGATAAHVLPDAALVSWNSLLAMDSADEQNANNANAMYSKLSSRITGRRTPGPFSTSPTTIASGTDKNTMNANVRPAGGPGPPASQTSPRRRRPSSSTPLAIPTITGSTTTVTTATTADLRDASGDDTESLADLTPQLAYKLSKKIAHLTKVIAAVHVRNDHHSAAMAAVVQAYEQELVGAARNHQEQVDLVRTQAHAHLDETMAAVTVQHATVVSDLETRNRALVSQAAMELDRVRSECARQLNEADKRRVEAELKYEQVMVKVDEQAREYSILEQQSRALQEQLSETQSQLESEKAARVSDAQRSAQALAHALEEHERNASATLAAHAVEIQAQITAHAAETESHQRAVAHLQTELASQAITLTATEESRNAALDTVASLQNDLAHARGAASASATDAASGHARAAAFAADLDGERLAAAALAAAHDQTLRDLAASQRAVQDLAAARATDADAHSRATETWTRAAAEFENQLKRVRTDLAAARRDTEAARGTGEAAAREFALERKRLEEKLRHKDREAKDLVLKLREVEKNLSADLNTASVRVSELEAELEAAELRTSQERASLAQATNESGTVIASLEAVLERTQFQLAEKEADFATLLAARDASTSKLASDLSTARTQWTRDMAQLRTQHAQDLAALNTTRASEKSAADSAAQLQQEQVVHWTRAAKELEVQSSRKDAVLAELKAAVEVARAQERTFGRQIAELRVHCDALTLELDQMRSGNAALMETCDANASSAQAAQRDSEMLKAELAAVTAALEQQKLSTERLESELGVVPGLSTDLETERRQVQALTEQVDELKQRADAADMQIEALAFERDALNEELAAATAAVTASERALAQAMEAHAVELDRERTVGLQRVAEAEYAHETKMSRIQGEHTLAVNALRAEFSARITALETESTESTVKAARREAELDRDLERSKAVYAQTKQDLEAQITDLVRTHSTQLAQVQTTAAADLDRLRFEHVERDRMMLAEFETAQGYMKGELDRLTRAVEVADVRYIHRESRQEDVDKIHLLELEVERRDKSISFLTEESHRLRLEIQAREDSLHRHFGSRPNVGIMGPTSMSGKKSPTSQLGPSVQSRSLLAKTSSSMSMPSLSNRRTSLPPLGQPSSEPPQSRTSSSRPKSNK